MSAVPRPDPASDPGLSGVAAMLADLTAQLKQLNDIAEQRSAAGLSAAELRVAANVKPSAPCILEEDATLRFGDHEIGVTLRAYGRWYKGTRGTFEPGGLQMTPSEPAGYSIDSVTLSAGANTLETEIYNALSDDAIDTVAMAAYEADPQ